MCSVRARSFQEYFLTKACWSPSMDCKQCRCVLARSLPLRRRALLSNLFSTVAPLNSNGRAKTLKRAKLPIHLEESFHASAAVFEPDTHCTVVRNQPRSVEELPGLLRSPELLAQASCSQQSRERDARRHRPGLELLADRIEAPDANALLSLRQSILHRAPDRGRKAVGPSRGSSWFTSKMIP